MSTSKLGTYIEQCPDDDKLRLQEWKHFSNGIRVVYGAVIRTKIEELWEDEETVSMIEENFIYGITSNEEEYDKASALRALAFNWMTEHIVIP